MLICVPGGPGYGGDQLARLGGLSASRTLVRVDMRGAGDSDPPARASWALADYADDLEVLRHELHLDRMDVFGHAHGGLIAAVYAQMFDDHIDHVIVDGVPVRPVEEFDTWAESDVPDYFDGYDHRASSYMTQHMGTMFEPAMAWFWDHESKTDFRRLISGVRAPMLVVTGDHDPMAGAAAVESLVHPMPRASARVIAHAGHFAWVENPVSYADAVEQFLRHAVRV